MGKRQIRVLAKDFLVKEAVMKDAALAVVLKSGAVHTGSFSKLTEDQFTMIDHHRSTHTFSFREIEEIILDKATAF